MQIRIQHQDGREECITLDASRTLRFGTRRSADVVLHGAGIFPIHFGILYYRDAFTVAASKQARDIRVNGIQVPQAALRDGDRIELGKIVITVLDAESSAIQVATPARQATKSPKQSGEKAWTDFDLPALSTDSSADLLADLSEAAVDPLENLSDDLLLAREAIGPTRRRAG
jgi:predicted component of type VI protein secretion system